MPKMDTAWCFIVTNPDGSENIPTVQVGDDMVQLATGLPERISDLRLLAQAIVDGSGHAVRLARFALVEELEVLTPQPELAS